MSSFLAICASVAFLFTVILSCGDASDSTLIRGMLVAVYLMLCTIHEEMREKKKVNKDENQ